MNSTLLNKLDKLFEEQPICKGNSSTIEEIKNLEKQLNITLPKDYIEFVNTYGGSVIGADGICGIQNSEILGDENFVELTRGFKERGFPIKDTHCVISVDGAGNPIFINAEHMILLYDHDNGRFEIIAETFEQFVEGLLNNK